MNSTVEGSSGAALCESELERAVAAYEAAANVGTATIEDFLPPPDHPERAAIAGELIRVELELLQERGLPRKLDDYRAVAPEVFDVPELLAAAAYEEFRLRRDAGEAVEADQYLERYRITRALWDSTRRNASKFEFDGYPLVGESFAGMPLERLLGVGAFSRVYLARQPDFGIRPVMLKVTAFSSIEPDRLGRLQHTNIVPVYSAHHDRGLLGLCMPYCGDRTLADEFADRRNQDQAADASANAKINSWRQFAAAVGDLAAALAHAHERGIVHGDVKPANVLVADDGTHLLMDFNLASDESLADRQSTLVGGTIPYMSAEHLEALRDGRHPTWSSDLFSLGVVLYEGLTGKRPFPDAQSGFDDVVDRLIEDRRVGAPSVKVRNPAVSAGMAAIVAKCLHPVVAHRYPSAAALVADIRHELADERLEFAQERLSVDFLRKTTRRRRSALRRAAIALVTVVAVALAWLYVEERRTALSASASAAFDRFDAQALEARSLLCIPERRPELVRAGASHALAALSEFGVLDRSDWPASWPYANLTPQSREKAAGLVGELLVLLANTKERELPTGRLDERAVLTTDDRTNVEAEITSIRSANWPEADAARVAVDVWEASRALPLKDRQALATSDRSAIVAANLMSQGRYADASDLLRKGIESRNGDPVLWTALGVAQLAQGDSEGAQQSLTAAHALQPSSTVARLYRGFARLDDGQYALALEDFDAVRKANPSAPWISLNRSLALYGLGRLDEAEQAASIEIETGSAPLRAWLLRARIRRLRGRPDEALTDVREARRRTPQGDEDWAALAVAHEPVDPEQALRDVISGLQEYPHSVLLLRNQIHLAGDLLNRPDDALAAIDRLLELRPSDRRARLSRGVILGRQKEHVEALAMARHLDKEPLTAVDRLQLACIYALVHEEAGVGRPEALANLGRALAAEPALAPRAARDADLGSLRESPEFDTLLKAAVILASPPRGGTKEVPFEASPTRETPR